MKKSGEKTNFQVCSGCKRASYCSAECQKLAWKSHKPQCLENRKQLALATSNSAPEVDRAVLYSQPGIVHEKLIEDIRKWTKRHSDWLGGCYFQVARLRSNPNFWRTHGVMVSLDVHNTRQSTYRFTFANAISAPFAEMIDVADKRGQGDTIRMSLKNINATMSSTDGEPLFTAMNFIMCHEVMSIVPIQSALASVNILSEFPDWEQRLSTMLKAPLGFSEDVGRALAAWWQNQRRAIVFCCANMLKLQPDCPIIEECIYFEHMYSERKNPSSGDGPYRFTPLKPVREPLAMLNQHLRKRDVADVVPQFRSHLTTRVGHDTGEKGTPVIVLAGIMGVSPVAGPYFITDNELKDIEIRDDWDHHFYSLLTDYDLKY